MTRKKRRTYTDEQKSEAVRLVEQLNFPRFDGELDT